MNSVTLAEALLKYRPHGGLGSASLIGKLASSPGADPWSLDLSLEERAMLGRILAEDDKCPSVAEVEAAVAALTIKRLRSHLGEITQEIGRAEASSDNEAIADLLLLRRLVQRALEELEE